MPDKKLYWKTPEVVEALQQMYVFHGNYFGNLVAKKKFKAPKKMGRDYYWTKHDIFRFEKYLEENVPTTL